MQSAIHSRQYFIPPYIYRNLVEKGDSRVRNRAVHSLTIRSRLLGRREILSQIHLASPLGEKYRTVFDAKYGQQLPGTVIRNEEDAPVRDEKINAIYDNLGIVYDFFSDVFGRNSLDERGQRLIASVRYDSGFDNAFWDGRQLVFGDSDDEGKVFQDLAHSLDVLAHEYAHGVIQHAAGLRSSDQPGALSESWADVFATLVKQYHRNQDVNTASWLVGRDILGHDIKGRALRSLKEPGSAYDDAILGADPQVSHLRNFVTTNEDRGGVHVNSGIPSRAFYLFAKQLGSFAWDAAGRVWYDALHRFYRDTDFAGAATITYHVAGELFGAGSEQQRAVQYAWEEVGVRLQTRRAPRWQAARAVPATVPGERGSASNGRGSAPVSSVDEVKQSLDVLRQRVDQLATATH